MSSTQRTLANRQLLGQMMTEVRSEQVDTVEEDSSIGNDMEKYGNNFQMH